MNTSRIEPQGPKPKPPSGSSSQLPTPAPLKVAPESTPTGRRSSRTSLAFQLFAYVTSLVAIALLVGGTVFYTSVRGVLLESTRESVTRRATDVLEGFRRNQREREHTVESWSHSSQIEETLESKDPKFAEDFLRRELLDQQGRFDSVVLLDSELKIAHAARISPNGKDVDSFAQMRGLPLKAGVIEHALQKGAMVTEITRVTGFSSGESVFIALPLKDFAGDVVGVLMASLSNHALSTLVEEYVGKGSPYVPVVFDPALTFFAAPPVEGTEAQLRKMLEAKQAEGAQSDGLIHVDGVVNVLGVVVDEQTARFPALSVALMLPEQVALGPLKRVRSVLLMVSLLVLAVAGALARWLGSRTGRPIKQMSEVAQRIADGDLSQEKIHLGGNREVEVMADTFNRMLDSLRELATTADRIAEGDLTGGSLKMGGQVGEAFNRMVASERSMIRQLSQTSRQLATTSERIYQASQAQEEAAHLQSTGVEEVTRTMDSLLESAGSISQRATMVLQNAEQTRQTSENVAERIGELSTQVRAMEDIVDFIRNIADRSDLLALNAGLEGSHAGEAGKGFSIVSVEMRRMAEEVMTLVEQVRPMFAAVRTSGDDAVTAIGEGRRLAEHTTESARTITMVTSQQRSSTEEVSRNLYEIAQVLNKALGTTQQTRSIAEELRTQATEISQVVGRFRTDEAPAGTPPMMPVKKF